MDNKPAASVLPHADMQALGALQFEADSEPKIDPANGQPIAPEPEVATAEVLTMVFVPLFEIVAPNWNISKSESQQLAAAYAAVLDKYFPDGLSKFWPEIMCTIVTMAIIGPRLKTPRKLEEKREDKAS